MPLSICCIFSDAIDVGAIIGDEVTVPASYIVGRHCKLSLGTREEKRRGKKKNTRRDRVHERRDGTMLVGRRRRRRTGKRERTNECRQETSSNTLPCRSSTALGVNRADRAITTTRYGMNRMNSCFESARDGSLGVGCKIRQARSEPTNTKSDRHHHQHCMYT